MSGERNAWAPEEVTRLRQMVAEYASGTELADHFGRTRAAIYTKLSTLGIKLRQRQELEPHPWGGVHSIPKDKPPISASVAAPVKESTVVVPPVEEPVPAAPILPLDMIYFAIELRHWVEDGMGDSLEAGAAKIVGFGGNNDEGQAAVIFDLDGRRCRLRLEELSAQDNQKGA